MLAQSETPPASSQSILRTLSRLLPDRPPRTTWQVKASTLCNLRCRYCYEWDRLADRRRMTLGQWRRVMEAVAGYRQLRRTEMGRGILTTVVWHGGEPLLHPAGYVREVLALQREIPADADAAAAIPVRNGVQTNLTRTGETLDAMVEAGFLFSVSLDFAGGARLDRAGRDTGDRVRDNLRELLQRRASVGVAVVLGRHNRDCLDAIHDRVDRLGADWLRINPMLPPPRAAPAGGLHLSRSEVSAALEGLFSHWIERGARLPVQPLGRALRTALRRRMGRPSTAGSLEHVRFVVHPDGTLTGTSGPAGAAGTTGPTIRLGNLFHEPVEQILQGATFPLPGGPDPVETRLYAAADRLLDALGVQGATSCNLPSDSVTTRTHTRDTP